MLSLKDQDLAIAQVLCQLDALGQCSLLLEKGLTHQRPSGLCIPKRRIPGCQVMVWADFSRKGGELNLELYSDSLLVNGVLSIFVDMCHQRPTHELVKHKFIFLNTLNEEVISQEVQNNALRVVAQELTSDNKS